MQPVSVAILLRSPGGLSPRRRGPHLDRGSTQGAAAVWVWIGREKGSKRTGMGHASKGSASIGLIKKMRK